jgi:hypothetical protein
VDVHPIETSYALTPEVSDYIQKILETFEQYARCRTISRSRA